MGGLGRREGRGGGGVGEEGRGERLLLDCTQSLSFLLVIEILERDVRSRARRPRNYCGREKKGPARSLGYVATTRLSQEK